MTKTRSLTLGKVKVVKYKPPLKTYKIITVYTHIFPEKCILISLEPFSITECQK